MESRKTREADLERQQVQRFLLGLVIVLALLLVALEWNSTDSGWAFFDTDEDLEAEMDLSPLKRDKDEVPMMLPQEKVEELPKSEQLHLVEEDVELPQDLQEDVIEKLEKPENQDIFTVICPSGSQRSSGKEHSEGFFYW